MRAAETELRELREALTVLAASPDQSVREAEGIRGLATEAAERSAYNRAFAAALPLARAGDDQKLKSSLGALKARFEAAETDYNWRVDQKKDATEAAAALDAALLDYSAGLDADFDVREAARQEELLPDVTLTEDEEDDLTRPIDTARAELGGQASIDTRLMQLFDAVNSAEGELALAPESAALSLALARARTTYSFTDNYAINTVAQQAGATEEEIAALLRAASGEPDVPVVELDTAAADALAAEIAAQRAEEARVRAEEVAKAEEALAAAEAAADELAAAQAAAAAEAAEA